MLILLILLNPQILSITDTHPVLCNIHACELKTVMQPCCMQVCYLLRCAVPGWQDNSHKWPGINSGRKKKKSSLRLQPQDSSYLIHYVGYDWYRLLRRIIADCYGYIEVLNISHEVCDLLELWLELKLELDVYQADCQAQPSTGRKS